MGLLDNIAGKVIGNLGTGDKSQSVMLQAAIKLFNEYGGLNGILDKFRAGGFAAEADSWVSKGPNLPITPMQIEQVLGSAILADIAARLGMPTADISRSLAEYLPKTIDRLTPDGMLPKNQSALLMQAMSMFKG
jgi:uncharacterized protein YidB (DUF937 family)